MSTAMSSKRSFISERHEARDSNGLAFLALIAGMVIMAVGVLADIQLLAAVGFVPFASSLLYFNGIFWAKRMDAAQARNPLSGNWMKRSF